MDRLVPRRQVAVCSKYTFLLRLFPKCYANVCLRAFGGVGQFWFVAQLADGSTALLRAGNAILAKFIRKRWLQMKFVA